MITIADVSLLPGNAVIYGYPDNQVKLQQASTASSTIPMTFLSEERASPEKRDDTDSESNNESIRRPQHITHRRRLQNSIFTAWYVWLSCLGPGNC